MATGATSTLFTGFGSANGGIKPAGTSSGLGSAPTPSTAGAAAPAAGGTKPASAQLIPAASLLDQLLENTKSLPQNVSGLGSILLGINELSERAKILREKTSVGAADGDTKAHYLFAGSGINAEDIAQELDTVDLHATLESGGYIGDTDLEGYLRYKREENIIASIENGVSQSVAKFDSFVAQNVKLDWNYEKLLICEHFGLIPRGSTTKLSGELGIAKTTGAAAAAAKAVAPPAARAASAWAKPSLGRSVLGPVSGALAFTDVETAAEAADAAGQAAAAQQQGLLVQSRQMRYATVVGMLNAFRLEKARTGSVGGSEFALIDSFAEVTRSMGQDSRTLQLNDAWRALTYVIPRSSVERQFALPYCDRPDDSPEGVHMRKRIIRGSRQFLEASFFQVVEHEISKYPQKAQLGGIPSVQNKIRAYLNLKYNKNGQWCKHNLEIVNDAPVWAMLYYLFRSGHVRDAVDYLGQNEGSFQKVERSFPTYLRAYAKSYSDDDGTYAGLSRDLAERLLAEFNHHIRLFDPKTDDPYKFALYKLIGRCELSRKNMPEVITQIEDWMWAQLVLVHEGAPSNDVFGSSGASDKYTLLDLQRMLVNFGARHFNPRGNNPVSYFLMLLLSGQYERAVHYLYKFYPVDAVHYAIALVYYGCLRVSSVDLDAVAAEIDLLTVDDWNRRPEINFARLVGYYTRGFRRTDPEVAVDYLVLICLNGDLGAADGKKPTKGQCQLKLCHEALRELVLETREFAVLLGDVGSDGSRAPGVIESKMELILLENEHEYLHTITQQAAVQADEDGRTADAVLLYHLAEKYDVVIAIINKTLGESLAVLDLNADEYADDFAAGAKGVSFSLAAAEDPVRLATNTMRVYTNNPEILQSISAENREVCTMLLQIVEARRAFEAARYEDCLAEIAKVNVVPLEAGNDTGSIRRRAQQFGTLNESVARNVPALLVMAMECCVRVTREISKSAFGDASRTQKVGELRAAAKNCMIYAGMIQYRMPRE
ncbi:Nup93/Nic96-domain-containing protein [Dipodascopsis tothii]|uniref:Nup93/Nic96-domain-containing protein n=1 Tax=Dipodascopsis tothii TaxID=44089 RepID=UPI0034CDB439